MKYIKKQTENVINRVYKYKLKPRPSQIEIMEGWLKTQRLFYNNCIEYIENQRAIDNTFKINEFQLKKILVTQGRQNNEYLKQMNYGVSKQTLSRVCIAYKKFFSNLKELSKKKKSGENIKPIKSPRYQKTHEFTSIAFDSPADFKIEDNKVIFMKNTFKFFKYRDFPEGSTIRGLSLVKEPSGWYICVTLEIPCQPVIVNEEKPQAGIDLGLKSFITASDGTVEETQKLYQNSEAKLANLQRKQATKTKFSYRWKQIAKQIAKLYHKVANQRKEWQRLTAKKLTTKYSAIYHEDLRITNLVKRPKVKQDEESGEFLPNGASRKSGLNKSILNASWGTFLMALRSAGERFGCLIKEVSAKNTTQMCSNCKQLPTKKIELHDRQYNCEYCGLNMDRDLNASLNILKLGVCNV